MNSSDYLHEYDNLRNEAMFLKKQYIENNEGTKDKYLKLFNDAEMLIEMKYSDFRLSMNKELELLNIDFKQIGDIRYRNAKFLHDSLSKMDNVGMLNLHKDDVPLFVPIFVEQSYRNYLRNELINNKIYCPIHWPFSSIHKSKSPIYDEEISIVCDQRYEIDDMKKIIKVIRESYGKFYKI